MPKIEIKPISELGKDEECIWGDDHKKVKHISIYEGRVYYYCSQKCIVKDIQLPDEQIYKL